MATARWKAPRMDAFKANLAKIDANKDGNPREEFAAALKAGTIN